MSKKQEFDNMRARSRYFRLLLYPDNLQHCEVSKRIRDGFVDSYVGITHNAMFDSDGEEETKQHEHYVLFFENPRRTDSLCRCLGFLNDLGEPDDTFCRAIVKHQKRDVDKQLKSCLVYLTHANSPEKEQYLLTSLFGTEDLIERTKKETARYLADKLSMSDCVEACLDWIKHQPEAISVSYFARWLCNSPYFKACNNWMVRESLLEHNQRIYAAFSKARFEAIQNGYSPMVAKKIQMLGEYEEILSLEDLVGYD